MLDPKRHKSPKNFETLIYVIHVQFQSFASYIFSAPFHPEINLQFLTNGLFKTNDRKKGFPSWRLLVRRRFLLIALPLLNWATILCSVEASERSYKDSTRLESTNVVKRFAIPSFFLFLFFFSFQSYLVQKAEVSVVKTSWMKRFDGTKDALDVLLFASREVSTVGSL